METLISVLQAWVPVIVVLVTGGGWIAIRRLQRAVAAKHEAEADDAKASAISRLQDAALKLVDPLANRIAELEQKVEELRADIHRYREDERLYQTMLEAKDRRIAELSKEVGAANAERVELRARVQHLEDVCRRAGINGE